jgi:hypothetical protein
VQVSLSVADSGGMTMTPPAPGVLVQVADAASRQRQGEQDLREAVTRARAEGWSWTAISAHLGVSRQAARERFRGVDQEVGA